MEEFNLDLDLDEATQSRIAHAEFLESIKDWALGAAMVVAPFAKVATEMQSDSLNKEMLHDIFTQLPFGIMLLVDQFNEFYDLMQKEAVKVLGAPFPLHKEHSSTCGQEDGTCGHQDHYTEGDSK